MSSEHKQKRAIFLDRDGIINVDHGYVFEIHNFEFNDAIFTQLKSLQSQGYLLIIVTNQSGIGRGYYTYEAYMQLTAYMLDSFIKEDIKIDAVYHCPHVPKENCRCRKPQIGMLEIAQKEFNIDMKNSWMIGDKESDMLVGKNAGVLNRIFVSESSTSNEASYNLLSVKELASIIKKAKG